MGGGSGRNQISAGLGEVREPEDPSAADDKAPPPKVSIVPTRPSSPSVRKEAWPSPETTSDPNFAYTEAYVELDHETKLSLFHRITTDRRVPCAGSNA